MAREPAVTLIVGLPAAEPVIVIFLAALAVLTICNWVPPVVASDRVVAAPVVTVPPVTVSAPVETVRVWAVVRPLESSVVNAPAAGVTLPMIACRLVPVATPSTGVVNVGDACMTNVLPVPVCAATEVAFPIDVIGPVKLALVTTVAAKLPVPLPVTPPVNVIVWSPVLVPLTVASPEMVSMRLALLSVTVRVLSDTVRFSVFASFRSKAPVPVERTPNEVIAVCVPPVIVGAVPNTSAPDPVSSVTAASRFALDGVVRKVATPVPKPLMPVDTGRPVQLVKVPEVGVPSSGVTKVGEVAKTKAPDPVSSVTAVASWAEVATSVLLVRLMVLLVRVSMPARVASVPVVGSVTLVAPVVVKVSALAPDVAKFPASARVPVVTVCPVAAALMMTALLALLV